MNHQKSKIMAFSIVAIALPSIALGTQSSATASLNLTGTIFGMLALAIFVVAYVLVIAEEFLHLRKSKPVMVAAGLIWALVGGAYVLAGDTQTAGMLLRANLLEYAELLLFLIAAMTYINTMQERNVFDALRAWLVSSGFSLRTIYWLTGLLAFFISPVADNLTTALLMGAVAVTVAGGNTAFIVPSCISIVVAANAGGAFSPFGDITTLMVWQKGVLEFQEFFALFVPALVNWLIPAFIMSFAIPTGQPEPLRAVVVVKQGGYVVVGLFAVTLVLSVSSFHFLHLPPVLGMMTGLGLLKLYSYQLKRGKTSSSNGNGPQQMSLAETSDAPFDVYKNMERIEWDTLMFFYGIILCVGGIGAMGYLGMLSTALYSGDPTTANIFIGLLSAVIDNIPVMYAVLTMNPAMSDGQWLLVTLTAGVGGSLLSIGSAAGVGLMGQARGVYTFSAHLKWSWAVALGFAASIVTHLVINADLL